MRVISFAVPKKNTESFYVLVDDQKTLYPHLHQHPEIQITLIKKMSGVLFAGDFIGDFEDGDVFVLGAGQPHVFRTSEIDGKFTGGAAISVLFEPNVLGPHFMKLPEMRMAQVFLNNCQSGFKLEGESKKNVASAIEKLLKARNISRMIMFLDILKVLSDLKNKKPLSSSNFQKPINQYDNKRITDIINYTLKNSDEPIRLAQVAKVAGMTSEAFCKYFKNRTTKTYFQFLNEVRIHNACKMLLQGGPTVATVSRLVGFRTISNFNRTFKRIIGITPVEYIYHSLDLGKGELPSYTA